MGNRLSRKIPRLLCDNLSTLNENLDSYRTFSSVIEKVFKFTIRKELKQDLKPLLDSTSSLSSFSSFRDRVTDSSCSEESESNNVDNRNARDAVERGKSSHTCRREQDSFNKQKKQTIKDGKLKQERSIKQSKDDKLKKASVMKKNSSQSKKSNKQFYRPENYTVFHPLSNNGPLYANYHLGSEHNIQLGYFLNLLDMSSPPCRREKTDSLCPYMPLKKRRRRCFFSNTIINATFSKEYQKQLKTKLRDLQKRPETYVILGLF